MAYTYDPSQNIQQGFQQAASGVGNIFTQVIAQQQRDYNLAENAFQNIEALKKNLNIFGQKSITTKANDLLGKTSSAILKNGKLDYSALGDIRQQVAEIGDLKQGYDVGAKEYERMLQLGVANKDNLVSFEKFYKDLSSKMGDENLVKNPQDLQKALADTYTSNLDSFKMFGKSYLSSNPYQKIAQDVRDPKTGALMRVQGELPAGWTLDAQGNKIPPAPKTMVVNGQTVTMDYADQELARLQATSPEQLLLMRKQAGFAGQNLSDKEIVKASIDTIPMTVQSTQVKSKDDLRREAAQAQSSEFEAATAPQKLSAQLGQMRSGAAQNLASARNLNLNADKTQLEIDAMKAQANPEDLASSGIVKDLDGSITVNYGKNVLLNSAQVYNPKTKLLEEKPFVVVNRKILKDGSQQLIGFVPPANMSKLEAIQASFEPKDLITTPLTKKNYTNLNSVFISKPFNKELARRNSIAENLASENVSATPKPSPAPSPAPTPATPKPTSSSKIQVTAAQVQAQAKAQKYDYNEYKTYLENNGYVVN